MDKIEKQINKQKNEVYMLHSEKDAIKASILGDTKVQPNAEFSLWSLFLISPYRLVPVALTILLVISVPVTYASQESVPGDFLYSFEVNVVEEIEELFHASEINKIDFHSDRLKERLEELQTVINEGNADELVTPVVKEIKEHTDKVMTIIEASPSSNEKLSDLIEVSALVEANADLVDIAQGQTDTSPEIEEIQEIVSMALNEGADEYTKEQSDEEISNAISSSVTDINELSEGSDSVTEAFVDNQLEVVALEITKENWGETLTLLAETKVELIKQDLLK